MRFEWDDAKNTANQKKHGVSFEQAAEVFESEYFEAYDDAHSTEEDRWMAIGPSSAGVLFVVFVEWRENVIRIVSARPALRREVEIYRKWREQ